MRRHEKSIRQLCPGNLFLIILVILASVPGLVLSQSDFIEKLDGTRLSYSEIDSMVSGLMAEARVTGVQPSALPLWWI